MKNTKKKVLIAVASDVADHIENALGCLDVSVEAVKSVGQLKSKLKDKGVELVIIDDDCVIFKPRQSELREASDAVRALRKKLIFVSSAKDIFSVTKSKGLGASDYITKPFNYREFIIRVSAVINNKVRIACLGGGTGLFNVLSAIKGMHDILPISIVSMSDSGGSSGQLRVSFGILPPGDLRRSLVALSNAPEQMNTLMQYRFKKGDALRGHSFGNIFLAALTEIEGSMPEAVKKLADILNIQGIVIPVTATENTLCARFEDGTVVKGEDKIDRGEGSPEGLRITEIWHEPRVDCEINAYSSIINSDIVIIGPGDLYTSVTTNLIVGNISNAICKSGARKIYICNLMTKPGETSGYKACDHIKEIVRYLGRDCLDYVLVSNTVLSRNALRRYKAKGQAPVAIGNDKELRAATRAHIALSNIGHETDLVRHDGAKLKIMIEKIIARQQPYH